MEKTIPKNLSNNKEKDHEPVVKEKKKKVTICSGDVWYKGNKLSGIKYLPDRIANILIKEGLAK